MNILFIIGRIALVVIFIAAGAEKLLDIAATAAMIQSKISLPAEISGVVAQIESATGMAWPQLLAIAVGVIELAAALMVAANIGTRGAALVLVLFTAVATFYFHDFWNMAGDARADNLVHAEKNLAMIGGLLVFVALGSWRPTDSAVSELPRI